jgi:hypothetical protein
MDDDFEIDLTVDAPDGLLPIRWVDPATQHSGNGNGTGNGHSNGGGGTTRVRPLPVARVVTLASFMARPAAPRPTPVLTLREPDEWQDSLALDRLGPVTLRDAMASKGARFLTVVVVTLFAVLLAATVLLWQRVEERHVVTATPAKATNAANAALLRGFAGRLNSIEIRTSALLNPDGTVATTPTDALQHELDALRDCLNIFQQQIASGRAGTVRLC